MVNAMENASRDWLKAIALAFILVTLLTAIDVFLK
jgi:hypothetical protein